MTAEGAIEIWFVCFSFKEKKKPQTKTTGLHIIEHFSPSHLTEQTDENFFWKKIHVSSILFTLVSLAVLRCIRYLIILACWADF